MPANGLEEVLRALERLANKETPVEPEVVWPLMASATIGVLKEVQGVKEDLKKRFDDPEVGVTTRFRNLDRRVWIAVALTVFGLTALAVHTGWTALTAPVIIP